MNTGPRLRPFVVLVFFFFFKTKVFSANKSPPLGTKRNTEVRHAHVETKVEDSVLRRAVVVVHQQPLLVRPHPSNLAGYDACV